MLKTRPFDPSMDSGQTPSVDSGTPISEESEE